jgi:two-component system response regulator
VDEARPILLVEDDIDDETLTIRAFAKNNIRNPIAVVRDGAEALDWLFRRGAHAQRGPGEPSVILLDLKLPKVDGLEVLAQIRATPATQLLPVVILTSSKEESERLRGYELRANSFIQKPVDFNAFLESVREIGLYWLVLNQPPPGIATR